MNSFFANIGKNIAAKLSIPLGNATTGAYRSDLGDTSPPLLSQTEISPQRICRKVNDLKSNKSSGPDTLSPKLLRLVGDDIVPSMYTGPVQLMKPMIGKSIDQSMTMDAN